ncbi:hypothetical protein HK104_007674 [Borealophlyctis nickersoniae]|nr:hypothetical protein HK104_007674 [Borealophlyctis nickersoniae]
MADSFHVTDDMADAETRSAVERALSLRVAECCAAQGAYHLACKKFTQGGDRLSAMKALLKSGDTEKIVFFANVSGPKQREIFVLAANYLQTLDWRNDTSIMKSIITFYTKAKALDSLAGFYESCAQVEIDEYQNYEKALGALRESLKCVTKAKDNTILNKDAMIASLQHRMDLIGQFVEARKLAKTDSVAMFRVCETLLGMPDIDNAVRIGDLYALMIESHWVNGYHQQAYDLLQKMRARISNVGIEYYLDARMVEALVKAHAQSAPDVQGDGIHEEIDEEEFGGE